MGRSALWRESNGCEEWVGGDWSGVRCSYVRAYSIKPEKIYRRFPEDYMNRGGIAERGA